MSVPTPHLQWPVRIETGRLAVVEQDTFDDVAQCVKIIASTPLGGASWDPQLGVRGLLYGEGGADPDETYEAVERSEPRAEIQIDRALDPGLLAQGQDRLPIKLRVRGS